MSDNDIRLLMTHGVTYARLKFLLDPTVAVLQLQVLFVCTRIGALKYTKLLLLTQSLYRCICS